MAQSNRGQTSQPSGGAQSPTSNKAKIKKTGIDTKGRKYSRWVNASQEQPADRRAGQAPASARTKRPNEVRRDLKDRKRTPAKNSNGNVKRQEILRQREKEAAIKTLNTEQAERQPNQAIENSFKASMPKAKEVTVDGSTITYTSDNGTIRELNIERDKDGNLSFDIDEDSAVEFAESMVSDDPNVRASAEQELYDLATVLEESGDRMLELAEMGKNAAPLNQAAKDTYDTINKTSPEEKAKRDGLENIQNAMKADGINVTSISSRSMTIQDGDIKLSLQPKEVDGKIELQLTAASKTKFKKLVDEGDRRGAEDMLDLADFANDSFNKLGFQNNDHFRDKAADRANQKAKEAQAKADQKAKEAQAKADQKAKEAQAKADKKAQEDKDKADQKAKEAQDKANQKDQNIVDAINAFTAKPSQSSVAMITALMNEKIASKKQLEKKIDEATRRRVEAAIKNRDAAREAGIKDNYSSDELHAKIKTSTTKEDIGIAVNNSPKDMQGKVRNILESSLSSNSAKEFSDSSGGNDYKMMSPNEQEFIAKMVLRLASFRYGAAAEVFQDLSVSASKEKND